MLRFQELNDVYARFRADREAGVEPDVIAVYEPKPGWQYSLWLYRAGSDPYVSIWTPLGEHELNTPERAPDTECAPIIAVMVARAAGRRPGNAPAVIVWDQQYLRQT